MNDFDEDSSILSRSDDSSSANSSDLEEEERTNEDSSILSSNDDNSSYYSGGEEDDERSEGLELFLEWMERLSEGETDIDSLFEDDIFRGRMMRFVLEYTDTFSEAARGDTSAVTIDLEAVDLQEMVDPDGSREQFLTRWEKLGRTLGTFPNLKTIGIIEVDSHNAELDYQAIKRLLHYAP